jgi:hypothetical protein
MVNNVGHMFLHQRQPLILIVESNRERSIHHLQYIFTSGVHTLQIYLLLFCFFVICFVLLYAYFQGYYGVQKIVKINNNKEQRQKQQQQSIKQYKTNNKTIFF